LDTARDPQQIHPLNTAVARYFLSKKKRTATVTAAVLNFSRPV